MQQVIRRTPRGQTLLEAVIAIGILMVGVVGTLVLINTTISLGRQNQDRIVAQNLAREGIEVAYSLRTSASLVHSQDAQTSWDSYLYQRVFKSGSQATYNQKYDLGVYSNPTVQTADGLYGDGLCYQNCTSANNFSKGCIKPGEHGYDNTTNLTTKQVDCDVQALSNYLYEDAKQLPPFCVTDDTLTPPGSPGDSEFPNTGYWTGNGDVTRTNCNFDGDPSGTVDISDFTQLIYELYLASWHMVNGFPTILPQVVTTPSLMPRSYIDYYNTPTGNPPVDLNSVWQDARARVYLYNNAFVQGSFASETGTTVTPAASLSGASASKFYRVVTTQEVCRSGGTETVSSATDGSSCGGKVGVLVTSEVRWPKWNSSTKATYQEFLYNWVTP